MNRTMPMQVKLLNIKNDSACAEFKISDTNSSLAKECNGGTDPRLTKSEADRLGSRHATLNAGKLEPDRAKLFKSRSMPECRESKADKSDLDHVRLCKDDGVPTCIKSRVSTTMSGYARDLGDNDRFTCTKSRADGAKSM